MLIYHFQMLLLITVMKPQLIIILLLMYLKVHILKSMLYMLRILHLMILEQVQLMVMVEVIHRETSGLAAFFPRPSVDPASGGPLTQGVCVLGGVPWEW